MPILEALKLDQERLLILANEANRQRALDTIWISKLLSKDGDNSIERALKAHGPYTDGFYTAEMNSLTARLKSRKV